MKKRLLSLVLVIMLVIGALSLSSCGLNVSKNPTRPEFIPEAENHEHDLYSDVFTTVAESDNVLFEFNELTTDIRLTNKKTGFSWSTEYYDSEYDDYTRGEVFTLNYYTTTGTVISMYSSDDSVDKGQFDVKYTDNGVNVQYGLGDINYKIDFPLAISPARADAFMALMDDDQQYTFSNNYSLIDYNDPNASFNDPEQYDEARLEEHKKAHPLAVDEPWYYMSSTVDERTITVLHDLWYSVGYTEQDFAKDSENVEIADVKRAEFNVEIDYTLVGDDLKVVMPESKIYYDKDYTIESIQLHPNLMDFDASYNGYYTLPDGSGSLLNFNSGKDEIRNDAIYIQMYGVDEARGIAEKMAYANEAIFPVYGCTVRGKYAKPLTDNIDPMIQLANEGSAAKYNGLFATVTSGESFCGIEAHAGSPVEMSHNRAFTEFRINECQKMKSFQSGSGTNETYSKYQFQRYLGDLEVVYHLLDGEDATYSGMANYYSHQLFGDEEVSGNKDYYSTVETMGLINGYDYFLGIQYFDKIPMTDFDQVAELATKLKADGMNNMNIRLTGWCNGGYEHGFLNNIKVSGELGGEEKFNELIATLKAKNIGFYPDVDYQYVYDAETRVPKSKVSYSLNNSLNILSTLYNPITFRPNYYLEKSALTVPEMEKNLNGFIESYSRFNHKNVSLRSIGRQITANYREEDFCDRQETLENLVKQVDSVKKKGYSIMGSRGDAPFISYLDVVNNLPLTSTGFDKSDYSIPFASMVLSGHIDYTGKTINLSNNDRLDLLQMIEAGAGAYYTLTAESYADISNSDYLEFYSTKYDGIKSIVKNSFDYLSGALKDVYGCKIVKHKILANGVNMVTYDNGVSIVVNYNVSDYNANGIKVAAKDYTVIEGGRN